MLSVALTSFVTGITEPIEYSFLFIAPLLYAIHAVLTGVSMAVTWALGVHDGFSFSAGLIDYVINWNLATKPWADHSDRARASRVRVLRDLPLRDHEVRSEDAGAGAGGGGGGHDEGVSHLEWRRLSEPSDRAARAPFGAPGEGSRLGVQGQARSRMRPRSLESWVPLCRPSSCYNRSTPLSGVDQRPPDGGSMSTGHRHSAAPAKKRGSGLFQGLQKVGRSLQLPIAVLPAAGILLRLGQPDMFGSGRPRLGQGRRAVFATAGDAIFDNLPLLFCIGIAIGFAKKSDGSTALAALVGFLVYKQRPEGAFTDHRRRRSPRATRTSAATYNEPRASSAASSWACSPRCSGSATTASKLSDWLGFFNGRRLVPIIMAFVGTVIGVFFGLVWEPIGTVITDFGEWMTGLGAAGAGIFGLDQPRADPDRHAPVRQHRLLVPDRRLHRRGRRGRPR